MAMGISVSSTHAQSSPLEAAAGDIGEEGSNEIRIEPNDTELAKFVRKTLANTQTRRVVWFLKPDDSNPIYPSVFRSNMMLGLKTEQSVGTGEGAFTILPDGSSILPSDINLNPSTRAGRYPSAGLVYKSSTTFTLASISYRFATPKDATTAQQLGKLGFTGNFLTNTLSITRIGVNAGPNGFLGDTDDIIYTSGPSTLPLHALISRGVGNWFLQSNIATLEGHIAGLQPYEVEADFFVAGLPSVHGMLRVVPTTPIPPPQPPAPGVGITASRTTVNHGESIVVTWNSTGVATSANLQPGFGTVEVSGSRTVVMTQNTTFSVTSSGPGGTSAPASVFVNVVPSPQPAPSITFRVNNQTAVTVSANTSVNLTWIVSNANSITDPFGNAVGASGNLTVTPTQSSQTFVMSAIGPGGLSQASVTVTVVPSPPPNPPQGAPVITAGLEPTGEVTTGTTVKLTATVIPFADSGPLTGYWMISTDGGRTWNVWAVPGFPKELATSGRQEFTFSWPAGDAHPTTYLFRFQVHASRNNANYDSNDTGTITVIPTPGPVASNPFNIASSLSISSSGGVAENTSLFLEGVTTVQFGESGPIKAYWEFSGDNGRTWHPWRTDGFAGNLTPGETLPAKLAWNAGPPNGLTYLFRLRIHAERTNTNFYSNLTPPLWILGAFTLTAPPSTPPPMVFALHIEKGEFGGVVWLTAQVPTGKFVIDRAPSAIGPWQPIQTLVRTGTDPVPRVLFAEPGTAIFRARFVQFAQ